MTTNTLPFSSPFGLIFPTPKSPKLYINRCRRGNLNKFASIWMVSLFFTLPHAKGTDSRNKTKPLICICITIHGFSCFIILRTPERETETKEARRYCPWVWTYIGDTVYIANSCREKRIEHHWGFEKKSLMRREMSQWHPSLVKNPCLIHPRGLVYLYWSINDGHPLPSEFLNSGSFGIRAIIKFPVIPVPA